MKSENHTVSVSPSISSTLRRFLTHRPDDVMPVCSPLTDFCISIYFSGWMAYRSSSTLTILRSLKSVETGSWLFGADRKICHWGHLPCDAKFEPPHDKTSNMACAPSKDLDQPRHPPSLIRAFTVRKKKASVLSYPLSEQWRLWSDWADAQADLSLRWAHSHFVGFVVRQLISLSSPK